MLQTPPAAAPPARRLRPRPDPVLSAMVVLAGAAYAIFSLRDRAHFVNGGFDLGIFDQVVWHYSRFEAPGSSIKALAYIWGDHFSPVLALLAPFYWLWSDNRVLLLGQAMLLAAAGVPIFLLCRELVGRAAALALTGAYLVFWGLQSAVAFDFHEVAFGPLLIASTLLAARRQRWGWYWLGVFGVLCVKEDLSFFVIFLGLYLALAGERRRALITSLAGVLWYVAVVKGVIPHYANGSDYDYWSYDAFGSGPLDALKGIVHRPWRLVSVPLDSSIKVHTLLLLILPFGALFLFAREAVLLIPLFAERFLSSTENYWGTSAHYSVTSAAVLVVGTAAGIAFLRERLPPDRRRVAVGVAAGLVCAANVGVGATFPLQHLFDGKVPGALTPRAPLDAALDAVPARASVATQEQVIARLTHRDLAAEISPDTGPTDYVLANVAGKRTHGEQVNGGLGAVGRYVDGQIASHVPVAYADGWLVLRRRGLAGAARTAALAPMSVADQASFEPVLGSWYRYVAGRTGRLATCISSARPCPGHARSSSGRLRAALAQLAPRLSPGCRQLATLATYASGAESAVLDAAVTDGPSSGRVAAGLAAAQASDANGYVLRFQGLCTPRFATPG